MWTHRITVVTFVGVFLLSVVTAQNHQSNSFVTNGQDDHLTNQSVGQEKSTKEDNNHDLLRGETWTGIDDQTAQSFSHGDVQQSPCNSCSITKPKKCINCISDLKNALAGVNKQLADTTHSLNLANNAKDAANRARDEATTAKNKAIADRNALSILKDAAIKSRDAAIAESKIANKLKDAAIVAMDTAIDEKNNALDNVTKLTSNLDIANAALKGANTALAQAKSQLTQFANSVLKDTEDVITDNARIAGIVASVADGAVSVIKQLDILPSSVELGSLMGKAMMDFLSSDFCIPYDCLAKKLGVDLDDIEIFSNDQVTLGTQITPKTCLQVTSVEFDTSKLGDFLDTFVDLEVLDNIYDEVKNFLQEEMADIIEFTKDIGGLLEDIKSLADKVLSRSGSRRLLVTRVGQEPINIDEVSALAYQKGVKKFNDLYEEHVQRVFEERNLVANTANYITFKTLELTFVADFGQTFSLTASHRAGYAGSVFDESTHNRGIVLIPGTLATIEVSNTMGVSMPYSMSVEGAVEAEFSYMGKTSVEMDLISGNVVPTTELTTNFEWESSVQASATMALQFASSTSLSLCIVPGLCVSVNIDAKQSSAAGFDVRASMSSGGNSLTPLYTDAVSYKNNGTCSGHTNLGYWLYVEQPAVVATIATPCLMSANTTLFEIKSELLTSKVENSCPCYDNPLFKVGSKDCERIKKKTGSRKAKICEKKEAFFGVKRKNSEWCPVSCGAC